MGSHISSKQPKQDGSAAVAVNALGMLLREPVRYQVVHQGSSNFGESFIAFLLVPEFYEIFAGDLIDKYQESYVLTGASMASATFRLIEHLKHQGTPLVVYRDADTTELLRWDESKLRGVLDEGYEFIPADRGVYVFARRPLILAYED